MFTVVLLLDVFPPDRSGNDFFHVLELDIASRIHYGCIRHLLSERKQLQLK